MRPSLPVSRVTKRKGKMAFKNVALCSSHPHLSALASAPLAATDWRRKEPKAKERSENGEEMQTNSTCIWLQQPTVALSLGNPKGRTGSDRAKLSCSGSHLVSSECLPLFLTAQTKRKQGWRDEGRFFQGRN